MRFTSLTVACLLVAGAPVANAPRFRSVWKAPEVSRLNFAGKKLAALVITDDQSLQISGEEALTRELSARGVTASATYRFVPREEIRSAERARSWFERSGVEGVVALRPLSRETSQTASAVVWSGYHQEFWSYYGNSWQSVAPVVMRQTTTVVVETLIYDLTRNRLVWAAMSETRNPKNLQSFTADLVHGVVAEMRKMKFVSQDGGKR